MSSQPHHAVQTIHAAAELVLGHGRRPQVSFWRRLFRPSHQHTFHGSVHFFRHVLENLLDVPPSSISSEDLAAIGRDVDRVVECIEEAAERSYQEQGQEDAVSLTPTVYTIRSSYEQLHKRGATKGI